MDLVDFCVVFNLGMLLGFLVAMVLVSISRPRNTIDIEAVLRDSDVLHEHFTTPAEQSEAVEHITKRINAESRGRSRRH